MTSQASLGSGNAAQAGLASIWVRSWGPQISFPVDEFSSTALSPRLSRFLSEFAVDE